MKWFGKKKDKKKGANNIAPPSDSESIASATAVTPVESTMSAGKVTAITDKLNSSTSLDLDLTIAAKIKELQKLKTYKADFSGLKLFKLDKKICQLKDLQTLTANKCELAAVSKQMTKLNALTYLSLNDNELPIFPAEICYLKTLVKLHIKGNRFNYLPNLEKLQHLKELDASQNKIADISKFVVDFPKMKLEILMLNNNKLNLKSSPMMHCKTLMTLDLSNNIELQTLPDSTAQCTQLKFLKLRMTNLNEIPPKISELANLTTLDLHGNSLSSIPSLNSSNLCELDVSNNNLSELPALSKPLEKLNVSHNQLSVLIEKFEEFLRLKEIDASHNKITKLSRTVSSLRDLKRLNLAYNAISVVPDTISSIRSLEFFDISYNRIEKINHVFTVKGLKELSAANNKLASVTVDNNFDLSIEKLDISCNMINIIDSSFLHFKQLKELNVSDNHLTAIPDFLAKLKCLTHLMLNKNRLKALPDSFKELVELKHLNVADNDNLHAIPVSLVVNLRQLESPMREIYSLDFSNVDKLESYHSCIVRKLFPNLDLAHTIAIEGGVEQVKALAASIQFGSSSTSKHCVVTMGSVRAGGCFGSNNRSIVILQYL